MGALAIIKAFDVIEDGAAGVGVGRKIFSINQFQFKGAPEAFPGGVVVTVSLAAHRGDESGFAQGQAIVLAGVLHPAVGGAEQVGGRLAMKECHAQS